MAELRGYIDAIGRPIITVVSAATGDPFLAMVDTGFNGWLMTSIFDTPTIGVRAGADVQVVEMGDGRSVSLRRGRVGLIWLGTRRDVEVYVSDEPTRSSEGRPLAMIGARLLTPHLLLVDYGAKTVDIETQD